MKIKHLKFLLSAVLFTFFISTVNSQSKLYLEGVSNTKNYTTLELLQSDRELSTFSNLIFLSGLAPSMQLSDAHTIFAPTNNAFRDMSIEKFAELVSPKNRTNLIKFIQKHIMPKNIMSSALTDPKVITSEVSNENIEISTWANNTYVGAAKIIQSDVEGSNGVVHIINSVID